METWYTPSQPSELPTAKSLLVLAPHPDDEIFGCGGLLARYRQQGTAIHVHILSDGAGHREEAARRAVFEQRCAESNRALALLDIPPASCAGLPDRGLAKNISLSNGIKQLLAQWQPDVLLTPSLWEIHPDHLAVARATLAACQQRLATNQPMPTLMFYEIGSPQRANCLIDITSVWGLKQQAMQCFTSQLVQQDYLRHIAALNEYRTYTLPASVRQAEAYMLVDAIELPLLIEGSADLAGRLMGRWIETALAVADIEAENLQQRLVDIQQQILLQAQENEKLKAQRDNLQARLVDVFNSRSWRLTAPLRWLKGGRDQC